MSQMAVRCDGVMIPCGHLSHMALGVINRDRLVDVWQGHPDLKRLRTRSNIALADFEACLGCDYLPYCTGNCPAVAYAMTGDAWRPSPDACYRRFKEAGGRLPTR
jgi:radical SAM protein with 4Fe4S-binding SPASM domain